jgi:hypothetical protein
MRARGHQRFRHRPAHPSFSSEHGPAINNRAGRNRKAWRDITYRAFRRDRLPLFPSLERRADERRKQGMRRARLGLEFRMELDPDKPRMLLRFDDLHEVPAGVDPAHGHPCPLKLADVGVVHLEAMTVALAHGWFAVRLVRQGPGRERALVLPRRMVAPLSMTFFCSSIMLITGWADFSSNSVEFAPASLSTFRAYSMTAIWSPRQRP